jgi:N-acetylglutamate synthase-like GNAT family acetyltransferase
MSLVEPGDAEEQWETTSWDIREASQEDVPAIATAVRDLLIELGASPTLPAALEAPARALIDDGGLGVLLVAEEAGQIVGVLGVSWQVAIRVAGRYGLIQELWVHPWWRGRTIGGDLLVALFELARRQQVMRIEVGLPSERFPHLAATEAFYVSNDFTPIGTRMRRLL